MVEIAANGAGRQRCDASGRAETCVVPHGVCQRRCLRIAIAGVSTIKTSRLNARSEWCFVVSLRPVDATKAAMMCNSTYVSVEQSQAGGAP
jgi:hypothetical protein